MEAGRAGRSLRRLAVLIPFLGNVCEKPQASRVSGCLPVGAGLLSPPPPVQKRSPPVTSKRGMPGENDSTGGLFGGTAEMVLTCPAMPS